MRYDVCVLKRVVERRFVMLLANMEVCRIDECGGVEGGVSRSYVVIVGRGRREREIDCLGREVISAHDIGFLGVVGGIIGDVIGSEEAAGSIEADGGGELGAGEEGGVVIVIVAEGGDTGDTGAEGAGGGEAGGVGGVVGV